MSRLIFILSLGFIFISSAGCKKEYTPDAVSLDTSALRQSQVKELLSSNWKSEIAKLEVVQRDSSPEIASRIGYRAAVAVSNSEGDDTILNGRWLGSEHFLWSGQAILARISRYLAKEGVVPDTGIDLFPELKTQEGYVNFVSMSKQDQLERYFEGINPFTGQFYQSFSSENVELGGIVIIPLKQQGDAWIEPDGSRTTFGNPDGEGSASFDGTYLFQVMGDAPHEILYDSHCSYCMNCEPPGTSPEQRK